MKLVFLTPGTGGWHCGACMRDNALASALLAAGHQVIMAPMYLPLHLDESPAAAAPGAPLFFGGISIYLRQRYGWFRHVPGWLAQWLDHPALLRAVARRANLTDAASHGEMTLAMLRLDESRLGQEVERLAGWLAEERPDALVLSTALQAGLIRPLKQQLKLRIICSFQGEDSFLDDLPEPFRRRCWRELAALVREADELVAPSRFYAELMRGRLGSKTPEIHVIANGISLDGFLPRRPAEPPVIGYLARLCRAKGLEIMVDAFIHLRKRLGHPSARLHLAGSATAADQPLIVGLRQRLAAAGLEGDVTWQPNLTREEKLAMLSMLSLFSVPAVVPEAFGLYLVEALAAGVPVVQPASCAFYEIIADAGHLVAPGQPAALAEQWRDLLARPDELRDLSAAARARAENHYSAALMAERFAKLCVGQHTADVCTDDFVDCAHGNGVSAERVHSARCRLADILSGEPSLSTVVGDRMSPSRQPTTCRRSAPCENPPCGQQQG